VRLREADAIVLWPRVSIFCKFWSWGAGTLGIQKCACRDRVFRARWKRARSMRRKFRSGGDRYRATDGQPQTVAWRNTSGAPLHHGFV